MTKIKAIPMSIGIISLLLIKAVFAEATLIENGSFENGSSIPWETPGFWSGGSGMSGVDERGRFCTSITTLGTETWGVQLRQNEKSFIEGESYKVRFKAWSSSQTHLIVGAVDESVEPQVVIFDSPTKPDQLITAGLDDSEGQLIEYDFIAAASSDNARFRFMMGGGIIPEGGTLCLDDIVVIPPPKNLISNPGFDDGHAGWELPAWWSGGAGHSDIDANGRMCTTVTALGTADWGAQLRQVGKTLVAGRTYTVSFDAWSTTDMTITYDVIDEPADYQILLTNPNNEITSRLDDAPTTFAVAHEVTTNSAEANFRFLYGGGLVPVGETVCVDNVQLLDPDAYSVYQPKEPEEAAIFTNQYGYFPSLSKIATYKVVAEDFQSPRTWRLVDGQGAVLVTGQTLPIGEDANSGDVIHHIDFTTVATEGDDFQIEVDDGDDTLVSHPFRISTSLFETLKYQALSYFYHNRSGVEILESVVGDAQWARPAGHLSDMAVETFVCKATPDADTCRTADVSGGWYDAGDHGKYVVNGGISVWTLLNQYERSQYLGLNVRDFGRGTMALPVEESRNRLPDILDEVKWQIEWMLKMQIPAGEPFAGMAYHKMHDDGWTGLPLAPHEDPKTRYIQAPTTAATLNLAAVGAQCYRIYKRFDRHFARRCLKAAEAALDAAVANPMMLSGTPAADDPEPERFSMTNGDGGGMYDDQDVDDDLFWALAELYVSTRKRHYKNALLAHELYGRYNKENDIHSVPFDLYNWGRTNMLGAISIATVGARKHLNADIIDTQVSLLVAAADAYAQIAEEPGYSVPLDSRSLPWGSNSSVTNNMMVLALANDLTCEQSTKYVDAISNGLSYLFGHNPLGVSYVTGYGEVAVEQPHHRFWANAKDERYPTPPPGVMSGGPNSSHASTGDPVSAAKVDENCPPETCFIDDIGSWSTNEITINWNSPFAWIVAYMDEYSDYGLTPEFVCKKRTHSRKRRHPL